MPSRGRTFTVVDKSVVFSAESTMVVRDVIRCEKMQAETCAVQSSITIEEFFPLKDAKGPRDLLEALLHAMIGYLHLFDEGWQLRTISSLNLRSNAALKLEETRSSWLDCHPYGLKHCRGILIDSGDSEAVKCKEEHEPGTHRSGTLPFMSQDMLDAMDWPSNTRHTALDDLESFIWVLVWECLHQGKSRNSLSNWDLKSLDKIRGDSPGHLASFKGAFLGTCQFNSHPDLDDSFLSPFRLLLAQWAGIRSEGRIQMAALEKIRSRLSTDDSDGAAQVPNRMDVLCRKTGLEYVRAGLEHLQNLQESWLPTTEAA
ncbi:hypothetical protein B0H15DRAFT_418908 [Mycena belliarum]|uniref:Fungal-type protein kinase domain-containing protein n=1 Tax=Mycena belliarum TaxID=1033014 RepID=A0AAD6XM11_9AGAR|nr:hypothetical protein B0H15DRAFT_418908 [Mycena belliae]